MTPVAPEIIPADEEPAWRRSSAMRFSTRRPTGPSIGSPASPRVILEMPICDRQRSSTTTGSGSSRHEGLDGVEQIGRDPGLCASAILSDTRHGSSRTPRIDPRTLANPLVAGEFGLRFYAGSPLRNARRLQPRNAVRDRQRCRASSPTSKSRVLDDLAAVVVDELELRLADSPAGAATRRRSNDDVVQCAVAREDASFQIGEIDQAMAALDQRTDSEQAHPRRLR